jgi:hypothetical protein
MNTNTMAMQENRINWKLADVHHTSLLIPGPYRGYIKGMVTYLNALLLMELVEAHDTVVLESFSDKQPRLPFTEGDLIVMQRRQKEGSRARQLLDRIIEMMADRKLLQHDAKEAIAEGDELQARYFYAKDYATSYLIRGMYWMMEEAEAGRGFPPALVEIMAADMPKQPEAKE